MRLTPFVTIPRSITGDEELVVIPRRQFERILKERPVDEDEILRWSKEATKFYKQKKLPLLSSLKELR